MLFIGVSFFLIVFDEVESVYFFEELVSVLVALLEGILSLFVVLLELGYYVEKFCIFGLKLNYSILQIFSFFFQWEYFLFQKYPILSFLLFFLLLYFTKFFVLFKQVRVAFFKSISLLLKLTYLLLQIFLPF